MIDYALVNNTNNTVENVIHWDGTTPWEAPAGHTVVNIQGQGVGIGYTYVNGTFTAPPAPALETAPATPTIEQLQAQLAALQAQIAALTPKS